MTSRCWIYRFQTIAFFFILWIPTISQSAVPLDSIAYHASALIRNHDLNTREKAFDYLNTHMGTFLSQYADFRDSFPQMEGLAIVEDEDLQLRIVTYQLYRDTSTYAYGGWIQSERLSLPVFLTDASALWESESDLDYMQMGPDNWYGAIYYSMKPLAVTDTGMTILLFGLDNYHFFTKRKVLETLVIRDSEVKFGESAIEMEADLPREFWKKRFLLDYSVQAPATLRFDEDRDKIIFDHLIFMPSDIPEQRIMRVPDGTYSGFEVIEEERKLVFIEKVFSEVMDEAPDGRAASHEKRDLFGNPVDNR